MKYTYLYTCGRRTGSVGAPLIGSCGSENSQATSALASNNTHHHHANKLIHNNVNSAGKAWLIVGR